MASTGAKATSKDRPRVTEASLEFAEGVMDMLSGRFYNGSARATLTLSDNKTHVFHWYHDEITYGVRDFMGKTMEEIREMHRLRDIKYLRER